MAGQGRKADGAAPGPPGPPEGGPRFGVLRPGRKRDLPSDAGGKGSRGLGCKRVERAEGKARVEVILGPRARQDGTNRAVVAQGVGSGVERQTVGRKGLVSWPVSRPLGAVVSIRDYSVARSAPVSPKERGEMPGSSAVVLGWRVSSARSLVRLVSSRRTKVCSR